MANLENLGKLPRRGPSDLQDPRFEEAALRAQEPPGAARARAGDKFRRDLDSLVAVYERTLAEDYPGSEEDAPRSDFLLWLLAQDRKINEQLRSLMLHAPLEALRELRGLVSRKRLLRLFSLELAFLSAEASGSFLEGWNQFEGCPERERWDTLVQENPGLVSGICAPELGNTDDSEASRRAALEEWKRVTGSEFEAKGWKDLVENRRSREDELSELEDWSSERAEFAERESEAQRELLCTEILLSWALMPVEYLDAVLSLSMPNPREPLCSDPAELPPAIARNLALARNRHALSLSWRNLGRPWVGSENFPTSFAEKLRADLEKEGCDPEQEGVFRDALSALELE